MGTSVLNHIQEISRNYVDKRHYKSALYWADKAASLSKYHPGDLYHLAQCMFLCHQYERAALLIIKRQLHKKKIAFRYLAAKCFVESQQWQAALEMLEISSQESLATKKTVDFDNIKGIPADKELQASIHLLKGDIYRAMEVRDAAAECYKDALKCDVYLYEAFDRLTSHHMMRAEEEEELLEAIPLAEQCGSEEEQHLLRFLYNSMLKKYNKPAQFEIPDQFDSLHDNLDMATTLAERHYYNCEFRSSFTMTEGILKSDSFHTTCLPLHVALLVELKESNKLFYLAHQLVAKFPDLPISWYAVGCYYLLQKKKQELCRRYLLKTTIIDKMYGPAWLAYGHSFAAQNEHDQAMAAYFTASQLMKGCHLPFLYIGLEYSVTNNTKLAEKFFTTALEISPNDPHVLHEMGVAFFNNKNYTGALNYFHRALEQVRVLGDEVRVVEWEPLLSNLGHCHRKLKDFPRALEFHLQALNLAPHSAETYSAIGLVYSYMEEYTEAIEYLHKSLGLRRDDVFTSSLLDKVIQKFSSSDPPLSGGDAPPEVGLPPPRKFPGQLTGTSIEGNSPMLTDSILMDHSLTTATIDASSKDLPTTSQAWPAGESASTESHSTASTVQKGPSTRKGFTEVGALSPGDDMELDDSIG